MRDIFIQAIIFLHTHNNFIESSCDNHNKLLRQTFGNTTNKVIKPLDGQRTDKREKKKRNKHKTKNLK